MDIEERIARFLEVYDELKKIDPKDTEKVEDLKAGLEELFPTEFCGTGLIKVEKAQVSGVKSAILDFDFTKDGTMWGYHIMDFYPPIEINWSLVDSRYNDDGRDYSRTQSHVRQESEYGVAHVEKRRNVYWHTFERPKGNLLDIASIDEGTKETLAKLGGEEPDREVVSYEITDGLLRESFFLPKVNGEILKDCRDIKILTCPEVVVIGFKRESLGNGYLTKFFEHFKLLQGEPATASYEGK